MVYGESSFFFNQGVYISQVVQDVFHQQQNSEAPI